jgi:hypothetical protein
MKKVLMMVCVVALLVVASAAYASDSAWLISIKAVTATAAGGSAATVGVGTSSEQTAGFPASNGGATAERTAALGDTTYHMRHDVARDLAAEAQGGTGYSWDLKIGARGTVGNTTAINICIWNNTLPNFGVGGELNHALVYGLFRGGELLKWFSDDAAIRPLATADDPEFTQDKWVNTSQLLKASTNWSPTVANMGFYITHTATNGAGYADLEDYTFKAFAPTVPEPGSFMALGSGLIGLAGFAIRRRK